MVSQSNEAKASLILQIEQIFAEKGLMRSFIAPEIGLTESEAAKKIQVIFEKMAVERLQQYLAALKRNYE